MTSRPYLLTRESYSTADGTLTILGTIEFETNFLNEYGGSFAVMTRADNQHGSGPGWEYSILRYGVRSNFWPAAWGQQHSLEIHEKPSPSSLSLLVAEGLEINPEAREYFFKIVDDGERVTLTIQDAHDAAISKTVSVPTNPALRSGFIGFEGCWGCPVWLDNVRIYRTRHDHIATRVNSRAASIFEDWRSACGADIERVVEQHYFERCLSVAICGLAIGSSSRRRQVPSTCGLPPAIAPVCCRKKSMHYSVRARVRGASGSM